MDLCKDKTALQAKRLTDIYVGKWLNVEGSLVNVSENTDGSHYASIRPTTDGFATVWISFAKPEPILETLSVGANVRAVARIDRIRELSLDLEEGELIP
jgi:hypothetical protein